MSTLNPLADDKMGGGGGDFTIKMTGVLVRNFEKKP